MATITPGRASDYANLGGEAAKQIDPELVRKAQAEREENQRRYERFTARTEALRLAHSDAPFGDVIERAAAYVAFLSGDE